jgi:hypothetical protein
MKSSFDRVSLIHHRSSTEGCSRHPRFCTVPNSYADKRLQGFPRPLTTKVCEEWQEEIDSANLFTGSDQGHAEFQSQSDIPLLLTRVRLRTSPSYTSDDQSLNLSVHS